MSGERSTGGFLSRVVRDAEAKVRERQAAERLDVVERVRDAEEQAYIKRGLPQDEDPFPDLDGDGLSDAQERAIGTRVDHSDSDGDGVPDGSEVFGRTVVSPAGLGGRQLIKHHNVRSDPLDKDTDDDGVYDAGDNLPSRYGFQDLDRSGQPFIIDNHLDGAVSVPTEQASLMAEPAEAEHDFGTDDFGFTQMSPDAAFAMDDQASVSEDPYGDYA
jgi:hypothetical protein